MSVSILDTVAHIPDIDITNGVIVTLISNANKHSWYYYNHLGVSSHDSFVTPDCKPAAVSLMTEIPTMGLKKKVMKMLVDIKYHPHDKRIFFSKVGGIQ